jgi:hypothetical protein
MDGERKPGACRVPRAAEPDGLATSTNGAPGRPEHDELAALRAIVEGTGRNTGEEFFQSLVRHLSRAIDVRYAFVAEFADVNTLVRTLAYWFRDRIHPNIEFDLADTPCADVVKGSLCHHPTGVQALGNIPEHFIRNGDLAAGLCGRDDLTPTRGRRPGPHS